MSATATLDPLALDTESPGVYWMGSVRIDIRKAKRLLAAKKLPPVLRTAQIAELARFVPRAETERLPDGMIRFAGGPMELDWEHIDSSSVDLSVPILLARLPKRLDGIWPIDGRHRIAKAIDQGLTSLPCYLLSAADSLKVITWPK